MSFNFIYNFYLAELKREANPKQKKYTVKQSSYSFRTQFQNTLLSDQILHKFGSIKYLNKKNIDQIMSDKNYRILNYILKSPYLTS